MVNYWGVWQKYDIMPHDNETVPDVRKVKNQYVFPQPHVVNDIHKNSYFLPVQSFLQNYSNDGLQFWKINHHGRWPRFIITLQMSIEWQHKNLSQPKKIETIPIVCKVMLTVFLDSKWVIYSKFVSLEEKQLMPNCTARL